MSASPAESSVLNPPQAYDAPDSPQAPLVPIDDLAPESESENDPKSEHFVLPARRQGYIYKQGFLTKTLLPPPTNPEEERKVRLACSFCDREWTTNWNETSTGNQQRHLKLMHPEVQRLPPGSKEDGATPNRKRRASEAFYQPTPDGTAGAVRPTATQPPESQSSASKPPQPAYLAKPGSLLEVNHTFYSTLTRTAATPGARTKVLSFELPIRSGRAWEVQAGTICRISTPYGPQVGDLNIWNLTNPRERFWASRTRQLHASHVTAGDRLWSCLPYLRPMVTIIGDSLKGYGKDEWGGRCHDLLGTRCDPYVNKMLSAGDYDYHCHSNLTRAVVPYGLTEFDVHDVLNVFQVTSLDPNGKYCMHTCPAKPGDYFEFFAEIDCLCALSTCPGGDLSAWGWDEGASTGGRSMLDCCRPLRVEVFEIADRELLKGWASPEPSNYRGMHGMSVPLGEVPQVRR